MGIVVIRRYRVMVEDIGTGAEWPHCRRFTCWGMWRTIHRLNGDTKRSPFIRFFGK